MTPSTLRQDAVITTVQIMTRSEYIVWSKQRVYFGTMLILAQWNKDSAWGYLGSYLRILILYVIIIAPDSSDKGLSQGPELKLRQGPKVNRGRGEDGGTTCPWLSPSLLHHGFNNWCSLSSYHCVCDLLPLYFSQYCVYTTDNTYLILGLDVPIF